MISGKIEKSGNGDDIRLIWGLAGRERWDQSKLTESKLKLGEFFLATVMQ